MWKRIAAIGPRTSKITHLNKHQFWNNWSKGKGAKIKAKYLPLPSAMLLQIPEHNTIF